MRITGDGKPSDEFEEVHGVDGAFSRVGGLEAVELLPGGGKGLAGSESRVGGVFAVCWEVEVGLGEKG